MELFFFAVTYQEDYSSTKQAKQPNNKTVLPCCAGFQCLCWRFFFFFLKRTASRFSLYKSNHWTDSLTRVNWNTARTWSSGRYNSCNSWIPDIINLFFTLVYLVFFPQFTIFIFWFNHFKEACWLKRLACHDQPSINAFFNLFYVESYKV